MTGGRDEQLGDEPRWPFKNQAPPSRTIQQDSGAVGDLEDRTPHGPDEARQGDQENRED